MAELPPHPDAALDRALADLATRLHLPATPDIAAGVASRLAAGEAPRRGRIPLGWRRAGMFRGRASAGAEPRRGRATPARRRRRIALIAAVLALIACGLALALPGPRDTIAERLGLRGVRIIYEPAASPTVASPAVTTTAPTGAALRLGAAVPLDAALRDAGFPALLPSDPRLGRPDEVYLRSAAGGTQLSFVYRPRPDLPATRETGVGLLITEFRAAIDEGLLKKLLGSGTQPEEVRVNGGRGFWFEGAPHRLLYRASNGQVEEDEGRLAGNTLVWEQGALIIRIESSLSKEETLRIATSLR